MQLRLMGDIDRVQGQLNRAVRRPSYHPYGIKVYGCEHQERPSHRPDVRLTENGWRYERPDEKSAIKAGPYEQEDGESRSGTRPTGWCNWVGGIDHDRVDQS